MFNKSRLAMSPLLLLALTVFASADQPRMNAARADLNKAKAQLQMATHNKGGHRAKAIGYINAAVSEINAGVRFDRRNNHASLISSDQPHMERALEYLRSAKSNLEAASSDKGGHRVRAISLVNDAINEVKKGIDEGE
jgi:hypothetical protein